MQSGDRRSSSDKGTLFLRADNTVERILATGNVRVESDDEKAAKVQSNQLELLLAEKGDTVRSSTFTGDVKMEDDGPQLMEGNAGRVVMNFVGHNVLSTAHSQDNVRMTQHQKASSGSATPQDVGITSSVIDS
jgi:lipopolysaccharide assembly outer membrane protein LptD (OstA)